MTVRADKYLYLKRSLMVIIDDNSLSDNNNRIPVDSRNSLDISAYFKLKHVVPNR